ncbi:MAG: class I SAM-dependent methyltransferase [Planctomycetaceae bacterium]|nr:class I SAM-dependent methyltransferase [Planctomycetaceae bacterium]
MRSGELATGAGVVFAPDFSPSGARSQATNAKDRTQYGTTHIDMRLQRRKVARGFVWSTPEFVDRMPFMIAGRPLVAGASQFDHNLSVREDRIVPYGGAEASAGPGAREMFTPDVPGFGPARCASYLAGTEGLPPRPQLVRAIELVGRATTDRELHALDIGCGPGREVLALCEAGFAIDAFDPYPEMLARTRALLTACGARHDRVRLAFGTLEDHAEALTPSRYDLVHAGFVLPFIRPHAFERCWSALTTSLRPGGVFAGQFFGPNDEFIRASSAGEMTAHGSVDVDRLFAGWTVIEREEVDRQGAIGRGTPKWWHVHHIVAVKPA